MPRQEIERKRTTKKEDASLLGTRPSPPLDEVLILLSIVFLLLVVLFLLHFCCPTHWPSCPSTLEGVPQ
jgi:hypothetical protein